jgi:ubiquinone/menaquinone biosynthesis C-methylase UbiE
MKLNHGCGAIRPKNWVNTDSSLNALIQRIPIFGKVVSKLFSDVSYESSNVVYANLNRKWKFSSNSAEIVYCSHLFEHLDLKSADLFLKESYRVLKSNGVIRVVVPDLYKLSKKYINEYEEGKIKDPSIEFMWALNLHREGQYHNESFPKRILSILQKYPHQHKYMYDLKSLSKLFNDTGFVAIKECTYGVSNYINEIKDVEGSSESYISVYLEARKP